MARGGGNLQENTGRPVNFSDFFHILNPSTAHHWKVKNHFSEIPVSQHAWVERSSHPTHLETLVEWALQEGKTKLAIWSGDGSFSRVLQKLYELNALDKTALALIPVGTCNDFARSLDLSSWQSWAGEVRSFDMGLAENGSSRRVFINNAGFGRAKTSLAEHRPSPIKDIFSFSEKRIVVEWEDEGNRQTEICRALFGIVFNAPYFSKGMHFKKDISPDDGVLNAFFVPNQSRLKLLFRLAQSKMGRSLMTPDTKQFDGQAIRIEADADLFVQVDGEPAFGGSVRHVSFSVLKKAIRIYG